MKRTTGRNISKRIPKSGSKPGRTVVLNAPATAGSIRFTPDLAREYDQLFSSCLVRPDKKKEISALCEKLIAKREFYDAVGGALDIPWFFIAAVHSLEADLNFNAHLHNGDPLSARTVHDPKGQPVLGVPPFSWAQSAVDALKAKGLDQWKEWGAAGILYQLERYNGFGYRLYHPKETLSPYLWSYSNHYRQGKYAEDGKWDRKLVSVQCGAAVILKHMVDLKQIGLTAAKIGSRKAQSAPIPPASPSGKPRNTADKIGKKLDAFPDRMDVRDWFYQPTLAALAKNVVNIDRVPRILDQGAEGACTGFALAAVINFLLGSMGPKKGVSSQMLYDLARRYDEWPGEEYEGSSARGAMKAWTIHGVCAEPTWPAGGKDAKKKVQELTTEISREARDVPGGAYYRVMHRQIRDMHAALSETGILYITLMVHAGWGDPGAHPDVSGRIVKKISHGTGSRRKTISLPVIQRQIPADGGHAVAIVGYTEDGFIVQNSWGKGWGAGGFALLTYEDYLIHATDVWVAQLGVPMSLENWDAGSSSDQTMGLQRAAEKVPLDVIRPFIVDIGNNGKLSDSGNYFTTPQNIERLFAEDIPQRTKGWAKKRILLYLHGGLNSEEDAGKRLLSMRNPCLENEIYPLHIVWETGFMETFRSIVEDVFTKDDTRASGWWHKIRDSLVEAKDVSLEMFASKPGTMAWDEMKENARQASRHPEGGMRILAERAREALGGLTASERSQYELHIVGHSAGSIFAAYALETLLSIGVRIQTVQFMAPAVTVELFDQLLMPPIAMGRCPLPTIFNLTDEAEQDDNCWKYGKSLLYLVSNAFEHRRGRPLLGMHRFVGQDPDIQGMYHPKTAGALPDYILAGTDQREGCRSQSRSHGGFGSDPDTLNSVLFRILGGQSPARPFKSGDFAGVASL